MRKFLSLVLALVMMMSLVTINAGAKEFTDGKDITYDEAVDVISTVGVVDGYANGSFNPGGNLTRGAAAKIICNLILGPTTAAELHADTAPYRDVPISHDFAGYIAYCQKEGIISGYADGSFRPGGTLTGYAFMKMLLGALGYDSEIEQYTGPNWSINVAKRAIGIKLNKGLEKTFNGVDYITREEACLYAFNTLQADMVQYGSRITTTINGAQVTVGNSPAESRKWDSQATRVNNIREDDIVQFAEEYFNKLEKKHDSDDFERPAYTWIYDREEIGTYVDYELMQAEYTTEVTGRELYDLLGATALKDNELSYFVDGADANTQLGVSAIYRGNQNEVGSTGNGVLTQVFLDKDREELTITSINTYLGQVTADYNEDREYAPVDVYFAYTPTNKNVDLEKVPAIENVKEDEFYLVNVSYKNDTNGEVVEIEKPEVLEGSTVTKFSTGSVTGAADRATKVTVGGTEYKNNVKSFYKENTLNVYSNDLLTDKTYNVFMDPYGYFIGIEEDEGAKNYVFITGFDRPRSNLAIKTADAAAIFLDGTMQEIKVNVKDTDDNIRNANPLTGGVATAHDEGENYFVPWDTITNKNASNTNGFYALNRWFTYRVNADGVYTLTPAKKMLVTDFSATHGTPDVAGTQTVTLKTSNLYLDDTVKNDCTQAYDHVGAFKTAPTSGATKLTEYVYADKSRRAYGNDDSVYITVESDIVDTTGTQTYAITDVSGVYTGIQNVEIEVDTTAAYDYYLEEGQVWAVYDDDNYIIGAVTNGEAKGGNATIAYVLSGPKSERIEDNFYYWEFEAVVDGTVQMLTVKENYSKVFNQIVQKEDDASHKTIAAWKYRSGAAPSSLSMANLNDADGIVELRFDADKKYVTSIKAVAEEDIYSFYGQYDKRVPAVFQKGGDSAQHYTFAVTNGGNTANNASTNILKMDDAKAYRLNGINQYMIGATTWNDGTNRYYDSAPQTLKLVGRTLYTTYDQHDEGLALASDAKAVTVQWENGDWRTKEHSSVSSAISQLSMSVNPDGTKAYDGEVVAALNSNGTAKWVVFTNYRPLSSGTPVTPSQDVYNVACAYIDPDGKYDTFTGNEYVGFKLFGTTPGRTYEVFLTTNFGGTESTRSIKVTGATGSTTTVCILPTNAFYGRLNANTFITVRCENGVGTYLVPVDTTYDGSGNRNGGLFQTNTEAGIV